MTLSTATSPSQFSSESSAQLFERAARVMPGGVSSPVRAFGSVGGTPCVIERAEGCHLFDVEGRVYLDFIGSWGPLILGHAHPAVVSAVQQYAALGTSFGAPSRPELELAEKIVSVSPIAEQVRFVNSGTEATMSALRLARAATGRDGVLKFDGCYHGHADAFLVKAGSGLATFGESSSAGVPTDSARWTGVIPLDDESALEAWFRVNGSTTAAVIVESVPANAGLMPQRQEWWACLHRLTREHGTLLIVDEVITGFRLDRGGYCAWSDCPADLVTYGKVIGGGLPVGAYAGSKALMERLAPHGPVYQAGTLSGNPVAMAAGLATLRTMENVDDAGRDGWQQLEALGMAWEQRMNPLIARECAASHPVSMVRCGSLFWLCFDRESAPRRFDQIPASGSERYARFFHHALQRGVMLAPSAYEVGFLNLAMQPQDLDQAALVLAEALEESR